MLVVGCAAAHARADFQWAQLTNNAGSVGGNASFGGTGTGGLTGGTQGNGERAPDGVFVTITSPGGAGTARVRIGFTNEVDAPSLTLYSVTVTGTVTITAFRWQDNGLNTPDGTTNFVDASGITPATPTNGDFTFGASSFSPAFAPGLYRFAFVTFSLTANSSVQFDAVSNPEPGSLALFALGGGALCVLVHRRRSRRSAARPPRG